MLKLKTQKYLVHFFIVVHRHHMTAAFLLVCLFPYIYCSSQIICRPRLLIMLLIVINMKGLLWAKINMTIYSLWIIPIFQSCMLSHWTGQPISLHMLFMQHGKKIENLLSASKTKTCTGNLINDCSVIYTNRDILFFLEELTYIANKWHNKK